MADHIVDPSSADKHTNVFWSGAIQNTRSLATMGDGSCQAGLALRGSRSGGDQLRNQTTWPLVESKRATTPKLVAAITSPLNCVGELSGLDTASRTPPAAPSEFAQRNAPVARSSAINHAALSSRELLLRA